MQQENSRRTNAERTGTTRNALLEAARRLFIEKSYAETGTPEIVAAAGVTRGALYHHFADKQALFRAVAEQEAAEVEAGIEAATPPALSPIDALLRGADAYLAAMASAGRARILLLDGPAVLGRAGMDEIDNRHAAASLRRGLQAAMDEGAIHALPVEPLTALLSAAFDRAALATASGEDPGPYRLAIRALIEGLARQDRTACP